MFLDATCIITHFFIFFSSFILVLLCSSVSQNLMCRNKKYGIFSNRLQYIPYSLHILLLFFRILTTVAIVYVCLFAVLCFILESHNSALFGDLFSFFHSVAVFLLHLFFGICNLWIINALDKSSAVGSCFSLFRNDCMN